MDSPGLVRTTPYFLLLSVGNVTLLLVIIHMRGCGLKPGFVSSQERLPGIQYVLPLVFMCGFLTAISGSLGLVGVGMEQALTPASAHVWFLGQKALEIIVKLALGTCILYLFDQRILSRLVSEMPASGKALAAHNALIALFLSSSTTLSYVSISKPMLKHTPAIFTLIACLIPLPLILYFITRRERLSRVQLRVWVTLALVQLFGSAWSCFAMVSGRAFALVRAAFLALWMSGMMFAFQMLHVPINTEPYERRSATGTPSEDFLSLRDPFMFPPPVSPSGTLLRSPNSTFISRRSGDMATITGHRSNHTISRTKSITSLPLLENTRTSPGSRESTQTCNRSNQANSRQRRVNSEPLLPLTRQPDSEIPPERSHWSDGSDDSLDYEFLSKIIIYPTDSGDSSTVSVSTSIAEPTASRICWLQSMDASSTQTIPERDITASVLESSELQEEPGGDCEMAHLEVETIRQAEYYPRYGPALKPCALRPPSPNLWRKL